MKKWYAKLLLLSIAGIECWASIESKVNKKNSTTPQSMLCRVLLPVYTKDYQVISERKTPIASVINSSLPSTEVPLLNSANNQKVKLKSIYLHNIKIPLVDKKLSYINGIEVRILFKEGIVKHTFSDNFSDKCPTLRSYLESEEQDPKDIDLSYISKSTFKNFISLLEKIYLLTDPQEIELVTDTIEDKIERGKIDVITALEYKSILNKLFTELDIYNLNESAIKNGINEIYDAQCFFKNLESTTAVDQLFNILAHNQDLEYQVIDKVIALINKEKIVHNNIHSIMYLLNKIDQLYGKDELQHIRSDYAKNVFCKIAHYIHHENIVSHQKLDKDAFDQFRFTRYEDCKSFFLDKKKMNSQSLRLIFPHRASLSSSYLVYIDYNKDMTKFVYTLEESGDHIFAILYDKLSKKHTLLGEVIKSYFNHFSPVKISADGKYVCASFCGEYINAAGDTKIVNIPNGVVISFVGEKNQIAYRPLEHQYKLANEQSIALYDIKADRSKIINYLPSQSLKIFNINGDDKQVIINMLGGKFFHYGHYGYECTPHEDFFYNTLTLKQNYFKILEQITTLECAGALKILLENGYFDGNCSLDDQTQHKLLALIPQDILDLLQNAPSS